MLTPLETDMLQLLISLQWSGTGDAEEGGYVACCPSCEAEQRDGKHFKDCELVALIRRAQPAVDPRDRLEPLPGTG